MLESYFVRPQTVDRIRASWIGAEVERYVGWLAEHGYAARCVCARVPMLVAFGEFAWARGARTVEELAVHVEPFVAAWVVERHRHRRVGARSSEKEVRGPIEQMLALVSPGFVGSGRSHLPDPFAGVLPDFFEYLVVERGLRPASLRNYEHHLRHFECYLARIGAGLGEISPPILSSFIADRAAAGLARTTFRDGCGVLRVFLRYAHREGVLRSDLSAVMEWPQAYRLSEIPRSITWAEVREVLAGVDRRSPAGKRDYAIYVATPTMLPMVGRRRISGRSRWFARHS